MEDPINPSQYKCTVSLNAHDGQNFIGLTNYPDTITPQRVIDKLYQNSGYSLKDRGKPKEEIPKENHYLRCNIHTPYEDPNTKLKFIKNQVKAHIVIKTNKNNDDNKNGGTEKSNKRRSSTTSSSSSLSSSSFNMIGKNDIIS